MNKLKIVTTISIIADILTISQWLEKILVLLGLSSESAQKINSICVFIAILLTTVTISCWFVKKMIRDELLKVGTHGIPCALWPYCQYKLRNKHNTLLGYLHRKVYHHMVDLKLKIAQKKQTLQKGGHLNLSDIQSEMEKILQNFHGLLYEVFGIDVSISVFLFSDASGDGIVLNKVAFQRSKRESGMGTEREGGKPYHIDRCDDHAIENYANRAHEYDKKNGNGTYLKNSIFDFILSTDQHSWLSNNLVVDYNNKQFYSSSPNYQNYYKSFAAFAILPPSGTPEQHAAIKGIVTFDSPKTNIFSENECSLLMGLMAHLLYEILEELKV